MKQKIKKVLQFILNPRLLLCFGIGWMITNGWSYVAVSIGTWLNIPWLIALGGAWLTFLWIPFTPEKLVTVAIAIALLRWLFPRDEKTLKVLRDMYAKAKAALQSRKNKTPEKQYIAVFDSGVGGVSVLRELVKEMPHEDYLYFGDSANAPYGTRSTEQVRQLTMAAAEKLLARNVKALVVACNTATAAAINDLRRAYPDKIIVGIEPALKVAADHFPRGRVGVMATPVTLREEKFTELSRRFPAVEVSLIPVPGLVELIEKGSTDEELEVFLRPVLENYADKLDVVVLGCTHYPFAGKVIEKILHTVVVDGGKGTALQTRRRLEEAGLLGGGTGTVQIENSANDIKMIARTRELLNQP